MESKGYLTETGRVVQDTTMGEGTARVAFRTGEAIIGRVGYMETTYNLRRAMVTREWIIDLDCGGRFKGSTRKDTVEQAMAHHTGGCGEVE